MENNEEILEEIEDVNEVKTTAANNQIDNMLNQAMDNTTIQPVNNNIIGTVDNTNETKQESSSIDSISVNNNDNIVDDSIDYVPPKKGKTAIIIILSVLLILDIVFLVLYLIGLDKLGFIK